MKALIALGMLGGLSFSLLADNAFAKPSWCKKTRNVTERAICASPSLGNLDDVLNTAYDRAILDTEEGGAPGIQNLQRRWLKRRNACGSDTGCIETRYNEQIGVLESYWAN
jgi:uncharacterized protein